MNQYPETIIIGQNFTTATSAQLTSAPFTVQNVVISSSGTKDIALYCGSIESYHTYGSQDVYLETAFYCPFPITVTTNAPAFVGLAGMNGYKVGTATPVFLTSAGTTTATTSQKFLNGFTYGELWIGLLLLFIFLMQFFGGIINQVAGLKGRARNTRNPNTK